MANFFKNISRLVIVAVQMFEKVADRLDISGMPTKAPPAPVQELISVVCVESLPVKELAPEPVLAQLVPEPQAAPLIPILPIKSRQEAKKEVMDLFHGYLRLLDRREFRAATEQRKKIQFGSTGHHSSMKVLEELIAQDQLEDYIPADVQFSWKEGTEFVSSLKWEDVPEKKRALSLLFALQNQAWEDMQAEKGERQTQSTVSPEEKAHNYARQNGGAGAIYRTGKTERERQKKKGPKPMRVGPAKGNSPGKKRR